MFEADTQNFLRLRCQEDLSFKMFAPPSAATIGGPWEEGGGGLPPPLQRMRGHNAEEPDGALHGLLGLQAWQGHHLRFP